MESFISELQRRNVVKVAVLYFVASWLVLQVADLLFDALGLPPEWLRLIIAILALGFPLILIFSWVYEMTPEGIKREKDIDRSRSIVDHTGRRINFLIVGLLVAAIVTVAIDRVIPESDDAAQTIAAATAQATGPSDQSIAVLPFRDMSAAGDQEYFSEGIAEEILNVLQKTGGLDVASRTTSWGFKGQESLGMPLIASKMNVRHVLEGSVRKSGATVRITAQLIDAGSDRHLWSETYDRELTTDSLFAIQDEIARAIVEQLGGIIQGGAVRTPARPLEADTENLDAYELYLQARSLFKGRSHRSEIARSIDLFENSIELDPGFARAWAGLSAALAVAPSWRLPGHEDFDAAVNAARKALSLDPELAMPFAVLGQVARESRSPDYAEALKNFAEAEQRDPRQPTVFLWRALALIHLGYFERAEKDLRRCLDVDPAYANCRGALASNFVFGGDLAKAAVPIEQLLREGNISHEDPYLLALAANGDDMPLVIAWANYEDGNLGLEWARLVIRAMTDSDYRFDQERPLIESTFRLRIGEELNWHDEHYLSLIFKNYADLQDWGDPYWWFDFPHDFKASPHRKRLMRLAGLPQYWRKHGFPRRCRAVGGDDFECE